MAPSVERSTGAGIPVMAHIGFTPQSEHALGGYRVQGRGDAAAQRWSTTRARWQRPARSRSCWRWCRQRSPREITKALHDPHHRHRRRPGLRRPGAGLAGHGRAARRHLAPVRQALRRPAPALTDAARAYAADVAGGTFPAAGHPSSPDPARALDVTHVGVASERVPSRPAGCGGSRGGQPQVPGDLGHGAVLLVHDRVLPMAEQWSGLDLIANRSGTVRWSATEPCAAANLPLRGRVNMVTMTTVMEDDLAPLRRGLVAFCYQMLGSPFDAEDAVQEVMERAWRLAIILRPFTCVVVDLVLSNRRQRLRGPAAWRCPQAASPSSPGPRYRGGGPARACPRRPVADACTHGMVRRV